MSPSAAELREQVRDVSRQAEVVGALAKEFDRAPRIEVLAALKGKVATLNAAWEAVEAILTRPDKP